MRWLLALIVGASALAAGCGGGPSYQRERHGVLHVTLDEYRIRPEHLEVPAGRVRLDVRNVGRLTHNLVIESFTREEGDEPHIYGRTDTLQPGAHGGERVAIVLRPGHYRLACTIANHDGLGQYGDLRVTG